jgi:hypothetical protein
VAVFGMQLYVKTLIGMLNSGSKDTSRRNTLLRVLYSIYFGIVSGQIPSFAMANGDDGLTWGIDDLDAYKAAAASVRITVRDVVSCGTASVDFCSHKYDLFRGTAELTSWPKAVYRTLCEVSMTLDDAWQVCYEMRYNAHHPALSSYILGAFGGQEE